MIALQRIEPEPLPPRRENNRAHALERTRAATRRRFARAQRRGYAAFLRVGWVAAIVVMPLMLYVMLTANLTSLNYALAHAQTQKAALLAATMRQDDRIARLESRERLAALAMRLKMHDPQIFASISLPQSQPAVAAPRGIALLGAVSHWLGTAVSGTGAER